ncbi:FitA-like ribbon-helix-helix domain-containing protein [Amphibiibacter pelophylacis]|uniref:Pantothenate metabolism flavoprotein n=1 Tax=Amphibiibacter pelophylacis TaxID=1799477 RepID=A0ACC6NZ66_9BURK
MPSITVRNLDESIKTGLRLRAAQNGWSMEQEVRSILQQALSASAEPEVSFAERINRRFRDLDADDLPIPPRRPARPAPELEP